MTKFAKAVLKYMRNASQCEHVKKQLTFNVKISNKVHFIVFCEYPRQELCGHNIYINS
jgi:hypothetical protein